MDVCEYFSFVLCFGKKAKYLARLGPTCGRFGSVQVGSNLIFFCTNFGLGFK